MTGGADDQVDDGCTAVAVEGAGGFVDQQDGGVVHPRPVPGTGSPRASTSPVIPSRLARIYAKLDVDSRTAAVASAAELGLIRR
ncbi:hypothetical protein GCM10010182_45750 [Actinomadura cremea]|nr:hypothetical protein GCM10010182_45750 [Actinomadura cremea]